MQQKKKKKSESASYSPSLKTKPQGLGFPWVLVEKWGEGFTFLELQSDPREITLPSKPWPRQWLSAV